MSCSRLVVVKDSVLGFYRLRQADSPDVIGIAPYWNGSNLREGYDAMIRANKDMKGALVYVVCKSTITGSGKAFKTSAPSNSPEWEVVETVGDWLRAKQKAKDITLNKILRSSVQEEEFKKIVEPLGISLRPGIPTQSDKKYVDWLAAKKVKSEVQ